MMQETAVRAWVDFVGCSKVSPSATSMCLPSGLDNCCHESFASSTPLSGSDITASHGLIEISVFEVETLLYQHEIIYCVADSVLNLLREPLDGSPDVSGSSTIVLKCHSHMSGFVIKR